jgi:hypothetical protein
MPAKEDMLVDCFRQLSPENQANLLACFRTALVAENSVKKALAGSEIAKEAPRTRLRREDSR